MSEPRPGNAVGRIVFVLLVCLCSFAGSFAGTVFMDMQRAKAIKEAMDESERAKSEGMKRFLQDQEAIRKLMEK